MRTFVPKWGVKSTAPEPSPGANKGTLYASRNPADVTPFAPGAPTARQGWGAHQMGGAVTSFAQANDAKRAAEDRAKTMAAGVATARSEQDWLRGDLEGTLNRYDRSDVEIVELDQKAYDALSDAEKDAVDFNTVLYNANQADSQLTAPEDTGNYAKDYQRVFSTGEGPASYNPNLVEALNALGITDAYGSLDDYTSLRAGVLASDFAALNSNRDETANIERARGIPGAGMDVARAEDTAATTVRQKLVQRLTNRTADLKGRMATGLEGMNFDLYGDFSDQVSAFIRRETNGDARVKGEQQALLDATINGTDPEEAKKQYSPEGTYAAVLARMSSSAEAQNWNRTEIEQQLQEMGLSYKEFKNFAKTKLNTDSLVNDYGDGADPVPVDWLKKQLGI